MKFPIFTFLTVCLFSASIAQENSSDKPQRKSFMFPKQATVNVTESKVDFKPTLLIREMPKQGSSKMVQYNYPDATEKKGAKKQASVLPALIKGQSFIGNQFSVSTPCDNDIAISDSGMVVSVMNTSIYFKNTNTNTFFPSKSLSVFTDPINNFHEEFDPKVIYDPVADRFILLCLVGNVDTTSKVVIGFSQTSNPTGTWNLYVLPGDPLNNNLWTDYPKIAMTQKEVFLSLNLLYNDSTWQAGFVETIVWQIDKKSGYSGQPLVTDLHSNIKFNGKAIRNLCPAKGGSQLYGPNMYFVSNRNLASQNDTVFLVNITDTIGSSSLNLTTQALISNQAYYFPPDGRQPLATQSLATNDSRNLGAFYENNKIQFVHNTRNPANNLASVYYGIIDNPSASNPTVTGYILDNDTMDFAYPNISYAGNSSNSDLATINFDHSSNKVKPGISAIQAEPTGNFSDVLRIQNGLESVNLLNSSLERWGDYSGSQRRYNRPGEVWVSGYFGYTYSGQYPFAHAAWIAQLTTSITPFDETSIQTHVAENTSLNVYPNPASTRFSVAFSIAKPEYLSFELYGPQGKLMAVLLRDWVKTLENNFSFSTESLSKGVYVLKAKGNYGTNIVKKVIIN